MKEKFFKKGVEPKGITLIALVVTIVVLLILAGVSIAMLAGEDGIINKAQQASLESNHSAVEEGIKLQYNEYQLQIKLGYTSNDFLTYLRNNETGAIIDEAGEINVENLLGNRLSTGNGTNLKDVYAIKETESTKYVLYYYEKSGNKIELTIIGENTNSENGQVEEVFPEVAGLYQTGTTTLLKSWEELKSENLITVEGTTLKEIDWNLEGDLVISIEIENLASYYYYEEIWNGEEARYETNKIIPISNINLNINNESYAIVNNENYEIAYEEIEHKLEKLSAVYIPSTIKEIPYQAFYKAKKLEKVVIQDNGVTSIGDYAFGYCDELTNIIFPDSLTSIGNRAFISADKLKKVVIQDNGVTSIGNSAFGYCGELTSITLPNSLTSIGDNAFTSCYKLTSITIPSSVTSIGDYAFANCYGLTSITIEEGNTIYDSRNNCNAIIRTEDNTLIKGCENTIIPSGVTSIGDGAFEYCEGLTSIEIPNGVTSIEDYAFYYCEGLTSITIPVSLEKIGDEAFYGCTMDLEINYEGTQEQWNQIDIGYGNYAITKEEEPAA